MPKMSKGRGESGSFFRSPEGRIKYNAQCRTCAWRQMFEESDILTEQKFSDKTLLAKLDTDLRVKVSFFNQGVCGPLRSPAGQDHQPDGR